MSEAIEVVVFRAKNGVSGQALEEAALAANGRISALPGFVSRSVGRADDGQFVDIVHWRDMGSAKAAAEIVMGIAECTAFFKLIDAEHMTMLHFSKVGP